MNDVQKILTLTFVSGLALALLLNYKGGGPTRLINSILAIPRSLVLTVSGSQKGGKVTN